MEKKWKKHQVTLADIHVDVMSFVSPAVIPDADFRERWASHEWENKIAVRDMLIFLFRFFVCGDRSKTENV